MEVTYVKKRIKTYRFTKSDLLAIIRKGIQEETGEDIALVKKQIDEDNLCDVDESHFTIVSEYTEE